MDNEMKELDNGLEEVTLKELKEILYSIYGFDKVYREILRQGDFNKYRKELATKLEKEAIKQVYGF